jgi:DNA gyrase subunit A
MSRTSAGRNIANVLSLKEGEKISSVIPVRRFEAESYLMMATKNGLVKKTSLEQYSRPKSGGIIGIALEEGDSLVSVVSVKEGDEVVLSTRNGMAIRFSEADARAMGRNTYGVKGINLGEGDFVVGMVVTDPDGALLTVCENGYGKRTPFGANLAEEPAEEEPETPEPAEGEAGESEETRSGMRYRKQRRGGKGLRDIRTSDRNGPVVGVASVRENDDIMLITAQGMVNRTHIREIRLIGRNTQGVRIMNLNEGDKIASIAKVAQEDIGPTDETPAPADVPPAADVPPPESPATS